MNTIFLAQMLGLSFTVMGLSMIFNKKWTSGAIESIFNNPGLVWLTGLVTLFLGAAMVALNNLWTSGLPLFITVLGWLTVVKGAFILVCPNLSASFYKKMNKGNIFVLGGVVCLILGFILLLM